MQDSGTWDRAEPSGGAARDPHGRLHAATPPASRPGACRPMSASCRGHLPRTFCSIVSAIRKPCPLLARSDPGDPRLQTLAADLDIRTDIPRYHVFRDGELVEEVTDITSYWRDDLVTFALGCSFSFEEALLHAGLRLRFLETQQRRGRLRDHHRHQAGRAVSGAADGDDARIQAGRCHPRHPDHVALSRTSTGHRFTSACRRRSASI